MSVRTVRRFSSPSFRGAVFALVALTLVRSSQLVAQEAGAPKTHTVKRGDTLWDLAKSYLGDPFLWPEIYRLNTDIVQDPHWIYPGEVLKLPGESTKVVAAVDTTMTAPPVTNPVANPVAAPAIPAPAGPERVGPTVFATAPVSTVEATATSGSYVQREPAVRFGEHLAAPWVDKPGGPNGWGRIMRSADVTVHRKGDEQNTYNLYDDILFTPPAGPVAPAHTRYLTYKLGPVMEELDGQVVIPTGVVEVVRPPRNGEAGIARIVKMFGMVGTDQRMIPFDSAVMALSGQPAEVSNGLTGTVRWLFNQPLLPSIQQYVVIDVSGRQGIALGDRIDLYEHGQPAQRQSDPSIPEIPVGRASIVRVTPYAATAIILAVRQPKIQPGTGARISAKMPTAP